MYKAPEQMNPLKKGHDSQNEAKIHAALLNACEPKNVVYFGIIPR